MRILQLCNRIPWPAHDGGAIAMLNMTRAFYELGSELHLMCLNTKKHHADTGRLPALFSRLASFEAVDINTDVTKSGAAMNLLFSHRSYNVSRFHSAAFEAALVKKLRSHEFDIIHIEGLHMCVYLGVIRKHSKARICLRAHNLEYLIWQRLADNEINPLKKFYLGILAKRLLRFELQAAIKVDAVIPITDTDAELFAAMVPGKTIFVSPTGLNIKDYKTDSTRQEWPGLFHLGALNWMPNVEAIQWFLKEVWPRVHKENPKLKFYIAGRDMPAWVSTLGDVGVVAVGEVPDAVQFMNGKGVMLVPLLSGSGMRIKIIEGMALGKTIISTAIGAEGIKCTDGKNIIIANEPDEFYDAIKKCLQNPEQAKRIGSNARKLAEEEYSNMALVGRLMGFYTSLMAK